MNGPMQAFWGRITVSLLGKAIAPVAFVCLIGRWPSLWTIGGMEVGSAIGIW